MKQDLSPPPRDRVKFSGEDGILIITFVPPDIVWNEGQGRYHQRQTRELENLYDSRFSILLSAHLLSLLEVFNSLEVPLS